MARKEEQLKKVLDEMKGFVHLRNNAKEGFGLSP